MGSAAADGTDTEAESTELRPPARETARVRAPQPPVPPSLAEAFLEAFGDVGERSPRAEESARGAGGPDEDDSAVDDSAVERTGVGDAAAEDAAVGDSAVDDPQANDPQANASDLDLDQDREAGGERGRDGGSDADRDRDGDRDREWDGAQDQDQEADLDGGLSDGSLMDSLAEAFGGAAGAAKAAGGDAGGDGPAAAGEAADRSVRDQTRQAGRSRATGGRVGVNAPEARKGKARRKARRGPADPVRALMYHHRDLCARAVDPLDIAAGLEARGVTERDAARLRHRDIFSLAEEMHARTRGSDSRRNSRGSGARPGGTGDHDPHDTAADNPRGSGTRSGTRTGIRSTHPATHTLPFAVALATTAAAARLPAPAAQAAAAAAGALLTIAVLHLVVRTGPLSPPPGSPTPKAIAPVLWLTGYLLYGDWLLGEAMSGATGADRAPSVPPVTAAAALALAASVPVAAWCARFFADRARRALPGARDLEEYGARVRPLLAGVLCLALAALLALEITAQHLSDGALARFLTGAGHVPHPDAAPSATAATTAALAFGALLFLARLLAVHGEPRRAAAALHAAATAQVVAVLLTVSARLPGLGLLGRPVELLTAAYGVTSVTAVTCGAAALALLASAVPALTRASAHRKEQNTMHTPVPPAPPAAASPAAGGDR
ncbi:hypothetical protein [Streptomyces boninensis]|uniref:hypothetical protein n=1 Tax=Streptomyces boninensis TaxID=2039455 RepID=UPI003B21BD5F